jgi:hypothetical protein
MTTNPAMYMLWLQIPTMNQNQTAQPISKSLQAHSPHADDFHLRAAFFDHNIRVVVKGVSLPQLQGR